jgi:hypothetical protein
MLKSGSRRSGVLSASLALAAGLAAVMSVAWADELPQFRQGLWEFSRTTQGGPGESKPMVSRRCTSPGEDMKRQNDMLARSGCQFSPITRSGNEYRFSSTCKLQGLAVESRSVLTAEGDDAYRVTIEAREGGESHQEVLVATRIGDC